MAKPIQPTPTLYGKDAIRFLREVEEEQRNPSKERVKMLKEARKWEKLILKKLKISI